MPELQVIAHHHIKAGSEQEVFALVDQLVRAARTEPGNVSFDAYRSVDDPQRYVLLERYVSREAFAEHRATPHGRRRGRGHRQAPRDRGRDRIRPPGRVGGSMSSVSRFLDLPRPGGEPLLCPNPWHDGAPTAEETFDHVRDIVAAAALPVTADLEDGYGSGTRARPPSAA